MHPTDVAYTSTTVQADSSTQQKQAVILKGQGADMNAKDYGKRKGKKKAITQTLVLRMIDIAKQDGRTDIQKSLWNSYRCLERAYTSDGKLYGKYCKNRFCMNCLGIRKAEMINAYFPVLRDWQDAYFVTLTVKACPKKELPVILRKCIKGLDRIVDKYEKREKRGTGKKLIGIRSLESNFNPTQRTYNPHFHLIVPDLQTAEILKAEWLKLWTLRPTKRKWVSIKGQKIERVWNMDSALVEVIKYGTKVFTDPTNNEKKTTGNVKLYARAFYNIIVAMKGIRLFGSFGVSLPVTSKEKPPARLTVDYQQWEYVPAFHDWINTETGNPLTGYCIANELEELLQNGIDTTIE